MRYDKLVRDNIPEIIERKGQKAVIESLGPEAFKKYLDLKLREELAEYLESGSVEELADLVEVIDALVKLKGVSPDEFKRLRQQKADERGTFERRLLLKEILEVITI